MAYNQATADILYKQLLLNIARSRHNDPIHFSGISNIDRNQADLFAAMNLRRPAPDAQLALL